MIGNRRFHHVQELVHSHLNVELFCALRVSTAAKSHKIIVLDGLVLYWRQVL